MGGKGKGVGSPSFDTLVRVSEGSFHEKQSAMPRTAGVSENVLVGMRVIQDYSQGENVS